MDRLTSISLFVSAVEEGSLAASARRFGLSPAMAGKYVSALEASLNVRLLQRTTRRLNVTEAGQAYYRRCKRILEEFEEANREASDAQDSPRGLLRIAAPVSFSALHLGRVVGKFLDAHPHVRIDVMTSDHFIDVVGEGIDLAIRIGRLPDSDLVARRLAPCRMVACASPDYLARHGTPKTPDELRTRSRLAFKGAVSAGDWTFTDSAGRAHAVDGPVRLHANNMQLLLNAALAGAGIAYGPTFVLGQSIRRGELVPVLPGYRTAELAIHAVYPTARHIPLKARRFADFLAAEFASTPAWDVVA